MKRQNICVLIAKSDLRKVSKNIFFKSNRGFLLLKLGEIGGGVSQGPGNSDSDPSILCW